MVGREGHFAPILNRVNVSYLGEMSDFWRENFLHYEKQG